MARTIQQITISLINSLVSTTLSLIGIVINPNDWIYTPGSLSQTDQKLLLLNTIASGQAINEQLWDVALSNTELQVSNSQPQTGQWFEYQMLNFQWSSSDPQVPIISPSTSSSPLSITWNNPATGQSINQNLRVIDFCTAIFSPPYCKIKVAAKNSAGLPADLDTTVGSGALSSATSLVNLVSSPGISYVVSSGNSDWLFLQIDLYFQGIYASTIFNNVSSAITNFLNSIPFNGIFKLSALEEAILLVQGVNDLIFINVAARPDVSVSGSSSTTWGTAYQVYLVSNGSTWNSSTGWVGATPPYPQNPQENQRSWSTVAGYIAVENGTSTGGTISNSQLGDYRVGSSGILNLNCIAQ